MTRCESPSFAWARFFNLLGRRLVFAVAGALVLIAPEVALAQGAGNGEQVTWFHMFLLAGGPVGTLIIWVLLLLSALSIGYTIHLIIQYRRTEVLPEETFAELSQMLRIQQYRRAIAFADDDRSFLGRLASAALREANHGYAAMERAIEEAGDVETARMLRPIEYLNVVGNIAPMMGLFGTVYGMIVAFQKLVAAGGSPEVGQLAGGISTALVTTFWGLIVAIPALAAYALIRNKIDALTSEGMLLAERLIEPFKPTGRVGPQAAGPVNRPMQAVRPGQGVARPVAGGGPTQAAPPQAQQPNPGQGQAGNPPQARPAGGTYGTIGGTPMAEKRPPLPERRSDSLSE